MLGLAVNQPSVGFRQIACTLALNANSSFDREARLMDQLGMGPVSGEKLRQVIEAEGQTVQQAQQQQSFALPWQAQGGTDAACEGPPLCVGVDGVMTRQITDEEKRKRRQKVAGKRGARANYRCRDGVAGLGGRRRMGPVLASSDSEHTLQERRMSQILPGDIATPTCFRLRLMPGTPSA